MAYLMELFELDAGAIGKVPYNPELVLQSTQVQAWLMILLLPA
jgi:hypothetical protein